MLFLLSDLISGNRRRKRGRRSGREAGIIQGLACILFLAIFVCLMTYHVSKADRPHGRKLITKVEVKAGDSVWGIAGQYYSSEFGSLNAYIQEIEQINGISADYVQAGGTLTIPYYENTPLR